MCGVLLLVLALLVVTLCPSSFATILTRRRDTTFIVFLMSRNCWCSVALPCGTVGWSAVCVVVFPDHTHFLLEFVNILLLIRENSAFLFPIPYPRILMLIDPLNIR